MSGLSSFLYRRLARWITCELSVGPQRRITLRDKHLLASFQDVFCHPFYWQAFSYLDGEREPAIVVDCGAHCGHFSVLADVCIRTRFPDARSRFVLVEPNPRLASRLQRTLREADLTDRATVLGGMLGRLDAAPTARLSINERNPLSSASANQVDSAGAEFSLLDLNQLVAAPVVDLVKIDIEGAEADFIHSHADLLARTQLLLMEWHQQSDENRRRTEDDLARAGLRRMFPAISSHGCELLLFSRRPIPP